MSNLRQSEIIPAAPDAVFPGAPDGPQSPARWAWIFPWAVLIVALLIGFAQPIASDTSVYLLQTRTLLETGNRYIDSHDNKGPMMVWLTAPAVRLLGANALAAGLLRALAAVGVAAILYRLLRRSGQRSRSYAFHVAALAAALPYSAVLWGDSLRPETYAAVFNALILLRLLRNRRIDAGLAGVLAAAILFLKSILVLPAFLMMGGSLALDWVQNKKIPLARLVGMGLGALLAASLILGWLAAFDSLPDFYRQTLQWPAEYRRTVELTNLEGQTGLTARLLALYRASDDPGRIALYPAKVVLTLLRSGVWPYFLLGAGLVWLRRFPKNRLAQLALLWGVGLLLELGLEHRRWPYPAAGLLSPLLLWLALAPFGRRGERGRLAAIWIASALLISGLGWEAARTISARLRGQPLGPYEALAQHLRPFYAPGESLLVLDNNYALHLLLPAPRPYRILPATAAMINQAERDDLISSLERSPPRWIAGKQPAHTGLHFEETPSSRVRIGNRQREMFIQGPYSNPIRAGSAWARQLKTDPHAPSARP